MFGEIGSASIPLTAWPLPGAVQCKNLVGKYDFAQRIQGNTPVFVSCRRSLSKINPRKGNDHDQPIIHAFESPRLGGGVRRRAERLRDDVRRLHRPQMQRAK